MRLLIVCQAVDKNHQNLGFFVRWIEEFAKNVESVVVIANEVGEYSLPTNVTVHSLGKEESVNRAERYARFYSLLKKLDGEYSHVFCHMNPEFVIAGSLLWRLRNRPIILWYVHGSVSWRLRLALRAVTAVCSTDPQSFRIQSSKVHFVGHGIDTEYFKPAYKIAHDEALIVSASRISPSKHIDLLIDAVEEVERSGVALRFSILGGAATESDKEYEGGIRQRSHRFTRIKFLGPKPQQFVRDALVSSDVFLNASTTGSMDKAVLEAMAAGALPVTSNVAFKEALDPYGLFVSTLSVEAFAAALRATLVRADRAQLAESLREYVIKNHTLATCISRILATFPAA